MKLTTGFFCIALLMIHAASVMAETGTDYCFLALGEEGGAERVQMEELLNKNLYVQYQNFCSRPYAFHVSFASVLYQGALKKKRAGAIVLGGVAPAILATGALLGGIFHVKAMREAQENPAFLAGAGEELMSIIFFTAGGIHGVSALIVGLGLYLKGKHRARMLAPYPQNRSSGIKRSAFSVSPSGAGIGITF